MPLSVGDKLGPYEILAPIGAGGMGDVYKARDTRLDRIVAIKVSKTEFSERFEREARAVAALNHPNICTLHDVGPNFLVMEYVEGAPLKGPLPLEQALKYAVQICAALDAAHKKGITHRDLKPANILATKTGIKLLDFGLAKLGTAGTGQAPKPDDATLTMALTGRNEIVGTLYYMSPEQLQAQANGQEIDARSDIFSFGLVLYEMLTGKRAFEGSSPASVIAAIMERPAPSIADVAPPSLDRLLKRCLAKDPDDRWQTARDLKAELEWITSAPESGSAVPVAPTKGWRLGWVAWGLAGLLLIALSGLGFIHFSEEAPEPPSYAYTIPPPPNSVIDSFAISPDGRSVAIAARANGRDSLWVRVLDSFDLRELAGTDGATSPFWSPDGRFISFKAGPVQKKIPAAGGTATNIGGAPVIAGGTWNRDGVMLLQGNTGGIERINASDRSAVVAPSLLVLAYPFFLPDGRRFLYTSTQGPEENRGIYVGSLDSKESRRLLPDNGSGVYAPPRPGTSTGHVLFGRDGSLVAQPVDGGTLRPAGELIPIAEKANTLHGTFSVSTTGVLLYQNGQSILTRLTFRDRSGKELMTVGERAGITGFALSPEEKRVVITRANLTANAAAGQDLWMYDLEHQTASRFTTAAAFNNNYPVWSPDGTKVAFSSNRAGRTDLYEKPAIGAVAERAIYTTKDSLKTGADWTRDGKFLVYVDYPQGKHRADILALPAGGGKPLSVIEAEFNHTEPQLSPNNRWLAYVSDESGKREVYVQPFSLEGKPAAQRWQISANGGTDPRWRRDGREVFFRAADQKLMSVAIRPPTEKEGATEFAFDRPQPLFTLPPMNSTLAASSFRYAVTADGKRFLVLEDSDNSTPAPITVLTNWQEGLKK